MNRGGGSICLRETIKVETTAPPSGPLGKHVLDKLQKYPVCTVSGGPGAGKSRDVPPSLLGTLMERDANRDYGVAIILELKEAQKSLHDHIKKEHPHIAP